MGYGGHPTDYKPEYCQMLIEHMNEGYSFASFAAKCDVCEDTLYEWAKVHPKFSEAKRIARTKGMLRWEELGLDGTKGQIMGFSSGTWIFNMKNRFGWTDKMETKETQVSNMSKEELLAQAKKLIEDLEKENGTRS